jgi:hypothetical protein
MADCIKIMMFVNSWGFASSNQVKCYTVLVQGFDETTTISEPKVLTMDYDYQSSEGRVVQVECVPVKTRIDATGEVHQVFSSDVASNKSKVSLLERTDSI